MRIWMTSCALGLAALFCGSLQVSAQDTGRAKLHRRAPLRIEVTPSRLLYPERLYRQCLDWHVIEHRPAGDTVVPRTRCWWALR
jgi:hypothetical protein